MCLSREVKSHLLTYLLIYLKVICIAPRHENLTSKALRCRSPANIPHLPLQRSSPEDATTDLTVIAPADRSLLHINRPHEDERLSWPCWLTYSGRFTHIVPKWLYPSTACPVQTSKSSPVKDRLYVLPLSHPTN